MLFILSKILFGFLRPSNLPLFLGWIGLALIWRRWRRLGITMLALCVGLLTALVILPVDQWLLFPLEDRFPIMREGPPHIDGIIVLGGALDIRVAEARGQPALNAAAERMTSFVALARRYPNARLAFTGGSGLLMPGEMTEADTAKLLFDSLGLADRGVIYENRSRTTLENADFLHALVNPAPGSTWILLTSAYHMPRSVGLFRGAGWQVIPWPVGFKSYHGALASVGGPLGAKLTQIDLATHEYAGLLQSWLAGNSSALFPAPEAPAP